MLITNESSPAIGNNVTNTSTVAASGDTNDPHLLDDSGGMCNPRQSCFFFSQCLIDDLKTKNGGKQNLLNVKHGIFGIFDLNISRTGTQEELGYQSFVTDDSEGHANSSTTERRHHHHHHHYHHRSNSDQAMDRLNTKIACTRESIRKEQTARDENVNEYLKLAANADADKQQLHRIKAVFEKKNQKSAHTISQLQKKLESYSKRVKDLQSQRQIGHRQPREMLRDVGQGLK